MLQTLKQIAVGIGLSSALLASQPALSQTIEIASGSDNNKLVEALAKSFEAENPGVTVHVPPGPRSYDDLTQDLLRRATVGEALPDILVIGNNQRLFAERGLAHSLDELVAQSPDSELASATPVVLYKGRVGEKTYGAAFGISLPVVLFNSELVTKAGGNPNDLPTDWEGIFDLAKRIDQLGGPVIGGFMEADGTGAISLLNLLQTHGGAMMSDDESRLTIDSPQGLAAMNTLRRFGEAGQARAAMTRDQARAAFGAGTIGVFVTMSSVITNAEKGAGDNFKVLSVPMPVVEGGSIAAAGPVASILANDQAKQALALKFINFTVSPAGQLIVAQTSGYYPLNQVAIDRSAELKAELSKRPNADAILSRLSVAGPWFTPPGPSATKIATITTDHLQRVVTLVVSPERALKEMQTEIRRLIPSGN